MSSQKIVLLFSLLPFLFASKCKKKDDELDTQEEIIEIAKPEVKLQVLGIDPEKMDAGISFSATISGTGFEEGATVLLGMDGVASAMVENSNILLVDVPPMDPGTYDINVENLDGVEHTLRAGLIIRELEPELKMDCREMNVYFELDKSSITADSKELLMSKSDCFGVEGVQVRVEGHCDERGTTEYNIALGQRRADSVKNHLLAQGVISSIDTVSFGEERPEVEGSTEDAWAKNRRAVIIISD